VTVYFTRIDNLLVSERNDLPHIWINSSGIWLVTGDLYLLTC